MQMKDSLQLAVWLRSCASLATVEQVSRFGLLENERFTEQAQRAYRLLWTWSAPRFSGEAGRLQERAYAKLGTARYNRRFERAKKFAQTLMAA
jgi:hypothetical protein